MSDSSAQVVKSKEQLLEKLNADVAGANEQLLERLLGEDPTVAARREVLASRMRLLQTAQAELADAAAG